MSVTELIKGLPAIQFRPCMCPDYQRPAVQQIADKREREVDADPDSGWLMSGHTDQAVHGAPDQEPHEPYIVRWECAIV